MGNSASSLSDSSSELDLRYKSNLVNHNYGSMYIQNRETSNKKLTTTTKTATTSSKYHSNLNLNQNNKKSKINKILKFISPGEKNMLKVQKRNENQVKNRRSKNFITKSLIFFRTPSQKDKSPNDSLKCSTPLDYTIIGAKSISMYVDHEDNLSSKFKTQLSLKSDKSSYKLNSSTDSKNDSGILSDYKRNSDEYKNIKNSMSTFSISDTKQKLNQISSLSTTNSNLTSSNNRRLSINSTIDTNMIDTNQLKNVNIRRTTTFHTTTTTKTDSINSNLITTNNKHNKPICLNIPREIQSTAKSKKIVVQASTSELLRCLTSYLTKKYPNLIKSDNEPLTSSNRLKADSREIINWLRSADRALLLQGWQEIAFMNPVNVVFVYLLIRDSLDQPKTVFELQCHVMSCLYLAFSYMGNEISYPLKPFIVEDERESFWQRIVSLMNLLSSSMLRINQDARFFTELFYELKSYANQNQSEHTIQKSITINSFKTYDKNVHTNHSRVTNKPLVYSNSSKTMLNSPINIKNTHRESCLYAQVNDAPLLFKPLAYCI